MALQRLDHRIQRVFGHTCEQGRVLGISRIAMEAIVCKKPTSYEEHYEGIWDGDLTYTNVHLCVDDYKRAPTTIEEVERDLFSGAGSLEMQARLVFDARMLAHEWEFVLRSFDKSKSLDRLLWMDTDCSPNVEFNDGMSQEDFDQETYDELVEDLEAAKMVVQNGGFNKI
ncbi:hypothetical protein SELMODRAFT_409336 [Selaginella moellendorffii]|uniref:Uncharacterized protein n=1 Tax=Selaginella moellendorffii TaxID=88036 RepID=D8RB47_SELML|nr:hypothetical protein SELMODRAFT_409336 [Selaginella moellendorffii]